MICKNLEKPQKHELRANFWEGFGKNLGNRKDDQMRKANYKGRCVKKTLSKCRTVCKTYNDIQLKYAEELQANEDIVEIKCNVLLEGMIEDAYMTDFMCVRKNGDIMVRECVYRKMLSKPMTLNLLDISRDYWLKHGVYDWGIVIDAVEE